MTQVINTGNALSLRSGTYALDLPTGASTVDSTLLDNVLTNPVNARLYEAQCVPKRNGVPATVIVDNGGNPLCLKGGDLTLDVPHGSSTYRVDVLQAALSNSISAALFDHACKPNSTAVLALSP